MKILILLLLPLYLLFALTLNDNQDRYSDFSVSHFYDASNELQINDIPKQSFKKAPSQFTFGYQTGTRWFKVILENQSQHNDFVLTFSESLWEEFDLYAFEDGKWKVSQAGLFIPLKQREIHDSSPAFALYIPKEESKTLYIKGKTVSGQLGAFKVFAAKEYFNPSRLDLLDLYLFFILFLFVIAFFNIYLFIAKQDKIYALYIAYILSLILWFSVKSGLYLVLDIEGWNHGLHVTGTIIVLLLTLFSSEFLELKQRLPLMYKVFNTFVLVFFILGISIAIDIPHASLSFNLISSVFFALLLFVSIKVWREGHLEMRYYLIALMIYMPSMAMLTLTFNALIDNHDLTRYAFLFGSFAEVIFFNSLMISHYHIVFKEKIRIQDELIEIKNKKENDLESEIKDYISELENTNKQLLHQSKELAKVEKKLRIEATTDALSTLYNRRYIIGVSDRIFDTAVRYNQNLSVVMIDLDDFKNINDTYGHAVGDDVIVSCSKILKENVRSSDILARYGGEEFLILIPNTPYEEVLALATRIREAVEKIKIPFENEQTLVYTMSLGMTHLQENDLNISQLIHRADKALYLSKSKGKNRIEVL